MGYCNPLQSLGHIPNVFFGGGGGSEIEKEPQHEPNCDRPLRVMAGAKLENALRLCQSVGVPLPIFTNP